MISGLSTPTHTHTHTHERLWRQMPNGLHVQFVVMQSDRWRRGLMYGPGGVSLFSHVCCTFYLFLYVLFSLSLHFKRSFQARQPCETVNLLLFFRITGWRQRTWRRSLISSTHRPRTCRTSSQVGGVAATTMAEPPASCPTTFLPPWWTWLLQPRASSPGWTGELC